EHELERVDRDLALVRVEDLDEPRHVRALELMREPDVHVERRDGALGAARALRDPDRVADRLDPYLVDRELAPVLGLLDVGDGEGIRDVHEEPFAWRGSLLDDSNMRPVPAFSTRAPQFNADARGSPRQFLPGPARPTRAAAPGRRGRRSCREARGAAA